MSWDTMDTDYATPTKRLNLSAEVWLAFILVIGAIGLATMVGVSNGKRLNDVDTYLEAHEQRLRRLEGLD